MFEPSEHNNGTQQCAVEPRRFLQHRLVLHRSADRVVSVRVIVGADLLFLAYSGVSR